MDQTPVHDMHNPDLLRIIPRTARHLIEIGCSSGALAREFKKLEPSCHYTGVDIDPRYVDLARRHCDTAFAADLEVVGEDFWGSYADRDCWIFGDTLEHFKDPWRVLRNIRGVIPANGCIAACIPNAQHWSLVVRLACGDFRYEDQGLLDRTHLRWFTRATLLELFDQCGFTVQTGFPRVFNEAQREDFLPAIAQLARLAGGDPDAAMRDAQPLQYVVLATPKS
ncbi:MAG: class I SAM-dependent methyltransferase [Rubrivivax sp.]